MMRLLGILLLSLVIVACGKADDRVNTLNKIKVTIKIEDHVDYEQNYLISISTKGKHTKELAILPKNISFITDRKKGKNVNLYTDVPYTLRVYKTDFKSMDEYFQKPKTGGLKNDEISEDNPLYKETFIPTNNTKTITILVD